MRIKISTDSTADIPHSLREGLGISVIPMTIIAAAENIGWLRYYPPDEFYPIIDASEKLPSSSQATPYL